jgi:curli production assembly/transport component CsgG
MRNLLLVFAMIFLTACAASKNKVKIGDSPFIEGTPTEHLLKAIPPLKEQPIITIAVYDFPDYTGQRKPSSKFSQLSMAVSQGADTWVIAALKAVGNGSWFKVVERKGLDSLVKERQLIRSTRELYDGDVGATNVLKPLVFAGLLIEGGIIGYDANVASGGDGARYFGIGVSEEYRVDQVTVSMRLVAVQTGEVLLTAEATKTIASHKTGADVFRFLDMGTKAFEVETGVAVNEPVNYAVRSAIEFCILEIIKLGDKEGLWKIKYY